MQNVLPFFTASLRAGCWTQPPIQRGRPLANELARSSYDQWQSPTLQSLFEPLRATSFDLNPVEAGLFSTVSHSRLVIGALREKPTHRENNHPEIVAPPCLGQPREHLLLFALLLSLSPPTAFLSSCSPSCYSALPCFLLFISLCPGPPSSPSSLRKDSRAARAARLRCACLPPSSFPPFNSASPSFAFLRRLLRVCSPWNSPSVVGSSY